MSKRPDPPADLPQALVDELRACTPAQLTDVARFAERLADARRDDESTEEDTTDGTPPDESPKPPAGVPNKATLTIKEINGNRYYYWQWREGEQVKSKYKGPVDEESD